MARRPARPRPPGRPPRPGGPTVRVAVPYGALPTTDITSTGRARGSAAPAPGRPGPRHGGGLFEAACINRL